MSVDLFAGISVSDLGAAPAWYERLLGSPPTFLPNDVEAVWEVAEHRYFDARTPAIAERGLEPTLKATYRDPDGSETGLGGAPL